MEFLGIGWMEMLVIGLVALLVVGPDRLPQAAQNIGRVISYATKQWRSIQEQVRNPVESEIIDVKGKIRDVTNEVTDFDRPAGPSKERKSETH